MLQLILENVRTFSERVEVPIRPLTILTGENSAGKSTFLAALATVCDPERFPFAAAFNRAPYNLGSFDTIATFKGGRSGRAKTFVLGYETDEAPRKMGGAPHRAEAVFRSRGGQPALAEFSIRAKDVRASFKIDDSQAPLYRGHIEAIIGRRKYDLPFFLPLAGEQPRPFTFADILLSARYGSKQFSKRLELARRLREVTWRTSPLRATSIAPVRSKPERTYGEVTEGYEPAGDHVPFLLERLMEEQPNSPQTAAVEDALFTFGQESGLFKDIGVRKLGNKPDDPFQLLVTMGGRAANLVDVGYGISQALPIIIQSALVEKDALLLMQQPEVHLHPRAQAALGSFFTRIVAKRRKRLVVETHSDFIIDRVRQHVAEGEIRPDDVVILFLERDKSESIVHVISIDAAGNIVGAPPSYREFFIQEEWRLLTRAP